jgi:5-methylcytosine-specific restriction endonuclease McrA
MTEPSKLRAKIVERDGGNCLLCGKQGAHIHEIVPRSALLPGNAKLCWSEKNRCLLCPECHDKAHTVPYRSLILGKMRDRYGYTYEEQVYKRY